MRLKLVSICPMSVREARPFVAGRGIQLLYYYLPRARITAVAISRVFFCFSLPPESAIDSARRLENSSTERDMEGVYRKKSARSIQKKKKKEEENSQSTMAISGFCLAKVRASSFRLVEVLPRRRCAAPLSLLLLLAFLGSRRKVAEA